MKRDVFQAITDPTRRAILLLVALQAMTPTAIAEHFASSRQAISKHIYLLQACDRLKPQQQDREIHYHVNPDQIRQVETWLEHAKNRVEQCFDQPDDVVAKLKTEQP